MRLLLAVVAALPSPHYRVKSEGRRVSFGGAHPHLTGACSAGPGLQVCNRAGQDCQDLKGTCHLVMDQVRASDLASYKGKLSKPLAPGSFRPARRR